MTPSKRPTKDHTKYVGNAKVLLPSPLSRVPLNWPGNGGSEFDCGLAIEARRVTKWRATWTCRVAG